MGKVVYCKNCNYLYKIDGSHGSYSLCCYHPSNTYTYFEGNKAYRKPKKRTRPKKTITEHNKNNDCALWKRRNILHDSILQPLCLVGCFVIPFLIIISLG